MSKPIIHKSMRGVVLNMNEMRTAHEDAVAVTGVGSKVPRMNARGDTLLSGGRIDRKREQIEADYNTTLQGNAKRIDVRAPEPDTFETPQAAVERMLKQQAEAKALAEAQAPRPAVVPQDTVEAPADDKPKRQRNFVEKED